MVPFPSTRTCTYTNSNLPLFPPFPATVVISKTRIYPIIGCRDFIKQKKNKKNRIRCFSESQIEREREIDREWNDTSAYETNTHDSLNREREREIEKERDAEIHVKRKRKREREIERKNNKEGRV